MAGRTGGGGGKVATGRILGGGGSGGGLDDDRPAKAVSITSLSLDHDGCVKCAPRPILCPSIYLFPAVLPKLILILPALPFPLA